jgi:predicted transcriptional regulator
MLTMSENQITTYIALIEHGVPETMEKLAELTGRDVQQVSRDLRALNSMNIIAARHDGRGIVTGSIRVSPPEDVAPLLPCHRILSLVRT